MSQTFGNDDAFNSDKTAPTEAWLFSQLILGKPIPRVVNPETRARATREELERLARFSSCHAEELSRIKSAEAEAQRERESLEWAARISTRAEEKLRALQQKEAEEREAWRRAEAFYERYVANVTEGNPDQLRVPAGSPQGGQWTKGGGGGGQGSGSPQWHVPSDEKGAWVGKKGESVFQFKKPINVDGKLVSNVEFKNGLPVLGKFAAPGKTAKIILTGDRNTDIAHAKEAWKRLNPGKKLPEGFTFHHDLLHTVEHTETIGGKKVRVIIGEMPLIPTKLHRPLYHQGSVSAAAHFYKGLGNDTLEAIKGVSKKQASVAGAAGDFVGRAAKKINPGKVANGLVPFVGRTVLKAIPLISSGLALLEFSDNVQAHGVGGAILRATPVLGDLISAHDLGSDLAKQITDDAKASMSAHERKINEPVDQAHEEANQQTLDAFRKLAPKIEVTNPPEYGTGKLINPEEIKDALNEYHSRMMVANQLRIEKKAGFDYNAAAKQNFEDLERALKDAAQRRAPVKPPKPAV